jgi:hypothetical protein
MFRLGWDRLDAALIDQRFVRRDSYNVQKGSAYQVWEYLVEFTDPATRIDAVGRRKRRASAARAADEARFKAKLDETR